jgi:hypothetical protein
MQRWGAVLGRSVVAGIVALTLLGAPALGAGAQAKSPSPTALKRCGYAKFTYGRSGVYPWHMSCSAAQAVVVGSASPHAKVIDFGPGGEGGAIRISGHYWVCTGQMGVYNCGYPYRPAKVNGERGYKGPFTEDVLYETCAVADPRSAKCPDTVEFTLP